MDTQALRDYLKEHATFTLRAEQDGIPVRGNAMSSGDDAFDKQVEDGILERLDNGDEWAWACVRVRAEYRGLHGDAYLGCCSYADEAEFRAGGYYEDMADTALDSLVAQVAGIVRDVVRHYPKPNPL
jgi:hypothetical protein